MAFGRGNGITIDIKAQISNLKEILAEMQKEIGKLDLGSSFGKSLKREADNIEKTLENLSKNSKIQITSETGVDSLNNKLTNVSDKVKEIGSEMQKVTIDNFSTEALENSIKDLKQEWENTKELLEQKINLGLVEELEKTPRLKKYLEDLGADVQNIDRASAQALLAENLERAGEEAKNAAIKLGELQEQYKEIKQQTADMGKDDSFYSRLKDSLSSLGNTNFTIDNVFNPQALSTKIQQWESRIDKLNQYTADQKEKFKTIIKEYFEPSNLTDINNDFDFKIVIDSFQRKFKESFSELNNRDTTSFFNLVFGSTNVIKSSDIKNLFQLDPNAIEEGRKAITDILSKFKPEELGKDANKIQQLLDSGSIEQAAEATIKLLRDKFAKVEEEYKTLQQNLTNKLGELRAGALKSAQASNAENTAQRRYDEFNKKIEELTKENQTLRDRLDAIQKQIDSGKAGVVENFKNTGKTGEQRGDDSLRETLKNTELYKTELDRVREKEKLVGKIEGIVQRWFSIYAAVRMVSNAIRSVISTVKELDKTITEIAIVTDMTQDDLWKQMSSYTDMARQYAASISGVYQVSQLYYQQGLETADVMALTEETLKMARISGLGYAEATDYMTNAVRSFKMEMTDAQRVVDVYSEIAASSATSTSELAVAMSKTASSAEAVGSSFENTTAMMAVMIEATRESSQNIGSALKSIISRYGEMTADPAKLVDSEGEEMSLNKVDKALKSVGISLQDTNHQFRDFDDVITELAGKWNTIDTNTQRYIATIMAKLYWSCKTSRIAGKFDNT